MTTEQHCQRLMNEYAKSGVLGTAAMKAGMHRLRTSAYFSHGWQSAAAAFGRIAGVN